MEKKCLLGSTPQAALRKTPSLHERLIVCKQHGFEKDYTVKRKIGEGSFGAVYEVVHNTLGLRRALKVVRNTQSAQYPSKEEIDVLIHLDHPNILRLYEFYEAKNRFFLITEFFEGEELFAEIIKQHPFTEQKACQIAEEIVKALHYTHSKGVVHRDIKAENILVKLENGRWIVKIIDWGLGTLVGNGDLVRKCGTPEYVAPEVFSNSYNEKCDMWSFGVILYIMLMGEMPFKGKTSMETVRLVTSEDYPRVRNWQKLSFDAQDLITRLLVKDPQKRLSAEECLKHVWFNRPQQSNEPPKALYDTLRMIRSIYLTNTLSLVAFNFINNFLANELDKRELNRIFHWLDRDRNGVLSRDEMLRGYSEVYGEAVALSIVDDIFRKLDTDHSGVLQYNEFITFAMMRSVQEEQQKFKEAFRMFDTDSDGSISISQAKAVINGSIQILSSNIDEEEFMIQEIIHQFDCNGNGLIDEEEFLKCLKSISQMFVAQEEKKKQMALQQAEVEEEAAIDKTQAEQNKKENHSPRQASPKAEEKKKEDADMQNEQKKEAEAIHNQEANQEVKNDKTSNEIQPTGSVSLETEQNGIEPLLPVPAVEKEQSARKKGRPKNSERKPYVPPPTSRMTRSKDRPN